MIRPFRQGDAPGVVETVREVFDEYGFTWDAEGYCSDLYSPERSYLLPGGAFWVAEAEDGTIVACIGLLPHSLLPGELGEGIEFEGQMRAAATDCSLERLYVRLRARRMGLGSALTNLVREEAAVRRYRAIELWSDKKLVDAHRLYESLGARRIGDRICNDPDESPEWGFVFQVP